MGAGTVSFLNINRCLKPADATARRYRLCRRRLRRLSAGATMPVAAGVAPVRVAAVVLHAADRAPLPEMTTEILDWRCEYTVENVKCDRARRQPLVWQAGWVCLLRRLWQSAVGRL